MDKKRFTAEEEMQLYCSISLLVSLFPPWISHGSCRHYTDSYTVHCKRPHWSGCLKIPSGSFCTGAGSLAQMYARRTPSLDF